MSRAEPWPADGAPLRQPMLIRDDDGEILAETGYVQVTADGHLHVVYGDRVLYSSTLEAWGWSMAMWTPNGPEQLNLPPEGTKIVATIHWDGRKEIEMRRDVW